MIAMRDIFENMQHVTFTPKPSLAGHSVTVSVSREAHLQVVAPRGLVIVRAITHSSFPGYVMYLISILSVGEDRPLESDLTPPFPQS